MQRWTVIQDELLPELRNEVGALTPKLEKVIHILEWVRIEEFVSASWCGVGRPPHERAWLANAFVAKVVLGLTTTVGLIERLTIDRALRRICGFPLCKKLPSEAAFSRAFDEFAEGRLAEISGNGYKLHLDTADCGVPIAALLSSASMHDSRAAVPLSLMSASRVTNLYDLMDAAYCSVELREHSHSLGHAPPIDHNPRKGEKIEFAPAQAIRYNERTAAERSSARLKDEFGGNAIMVKGDTKVMGHLMFGVLALSADQLMRLRQ